MDPPAVQLKPETSEEVKRKIPLKTIETGKSVFTTVSYVPISVQIIPAISLLIYVSLNFNIIIVTVCFQKY